MSSSADVEAFYKTKRWQRRRKAFAESRRNLCERCLERGIINPGSKTQPLEVHHKQPLTSDNLTDPAIAFGWDNLMLLCSECHHDIHERRAERRWKIDPDGRVVI